MRVTVRVLSGDVRCGCEYSVCTSLYVCEYGLLLMRTVHLNGLCVYDIVCGVTVLSTVTPQCTGLDVCNCAGHTHTHTHTHT